MNSSILLCLNLFRNRFGLVVDSAAAGFFITLVGIRAPASLRFVRVCGGCDAGPR
jgi:hypothetical protein